MDKITIERETVELAASLIQPLTGKGDREVYDALRAALAAQPAEPVEPVAWLRFQEHADRPTTVHLCDSDHPRAFQVYAAQPAPAAVPPDERIRVLREALEVAKNGLGWWQESCPELVTECDHEAMAQIDAALESTK